MLDEKETANPTTPDRKSPAAGSSPGEKAAAEKATNDPSSQPTVTAEEQVARLQAQIEESKDRMLRAQAELENYRKRVARQMEEDRRYADMPLLRDLLPVLDNVKRAIAAAEKSPELATLLEGIQMVAKQLETVLSQHHCTVIEALHASFDPHKHEAILQQPSGEFPPNTVLMETQTGYQLHDRVVRPAQVIVSKALPEVPAAPPQEESAAAPSPDEQS